MIVVILPDSGRNYLSKLYNDEWMRANGLLATPGAVVRVGECSRTATTASDPRPVVLARTTDRVGDGDRAGSSDFGDQPAARVGGPRTASGSTGIVGSVSERGLLDRAYRDPAIVERTVGEVMDRAAARVREVAPAWTRCSPCSRTARRRCSRSVAGGRRASVAELDVLEYLAHRPA